MYVGFFFAAKSLQDKTSMINMDNTGEANTRTNFSSRILERFGWQPADLQAGKPLLDRYS